VLTGWFAEFGSLESTGARRLVEYGPGAAAFAGATYDPTSHYRAAAVFDFHEAQGLTPPALREISRHQTALLKRLFEALDTNPSIARVEPIPEERRGGFLAIRSPQADDLSRRLRTCGVLTDFRGDVLRIGPAPYLRDDQLRQAMAAFGEILKRT
jgi:kynureninase